MRNYFGYGTNIKTRNGIMEIQDIKIGDEIVINDNSSFSKVKEILRITSPFWEVHTLDGKIFHVLKGNQFLTCQVKEISYTDYVLKSISSLTKNDYIVGILESMKNSFHTFDKITCVVERKDVSETLYAIVLEDEASYLANNCFVSNINKEME